MYLEPIFSSEDINRQLPAESKKYKVVENDWRIMMENAFHSPRVILFFNSNDNDQDRKSVV